MPLFLPLNALRRFTLKRDAMRVGTGEHNELHGSRETLLGDRKEKRKSDEVNPESETKNFRGSHHLGLQMTDLFECGLF